MHHIYQTLFLLHSEGRQQLVSEELGFCQLWEVLWGVLVGWLVFCPYLSLPSPPQLLQLDKEGREKTKAPFHSSSWPLRPCQSIQYKSLSTLIVFRKILANGKLKKFGVLVLGLCEGLFSELLEEGSMDRRKGRRKN